MASIGWNAVRLLVSWSRIEPRPGVYDRAYLKRVDATVARLARAGIYSIVDLHQDAWGPSTRGAAGGDLPGGLGARARLGRRARVGHARLAARRAATRALASSARRCWPPGARSSPNAPGPGGRRDRTRYVRMVGRLARHFARSSAGGRLRPDERAERPRRGRAGGRCPRLYARALAAVRAGERRGRGRRHLVLFEPSVLWSATGSGAPPAFRHDRERGVRPAHIHGRIHGGPISGRGLRHRARRGPRASEGRPCSPGSGASDPERAGAQRRRLLPAPPGASGPLPGERHPLDVAGELRRPAQGRRPPGGPHPRGVGRVRGRLPDQPRARTSAGR